MKLQNERKIQLAKKTCSFFTHLIQFHTMDLNVDLILIDCHMISYTYTLAIIYVLSFIILYYI